MPGTVRPNPGWVKKQKLDRNFRAIRVPAWDEIKDFKMDPGCYLLIKIYRDKGKIGVAICNYRHVILKEFIGKNSKDLYNFILRYDEKNKKGWITRYDHAAYLGKELYKAETALTSGRDYYQE